MTRSRSLTIAGLTLVTLCAAVGAQPKGGSDAKSPRTPRVQTLLEMIANLGSSDPDTRKTGMESLKARITSWPTRGDWHHGTEAKQVAKALLAAKRWDELDDYYGCVLQNIPMDYRSVEAVQYARVKMLLAQNRPADALAAAKSLYNVSSMEGTSEAILLIAECLIAARPEDRLAYEKFKDEQIAGASTQPSTRPATRSAIMASIHVESRAFDEILRNFPGEDYTALMARGNLLLMGDRLAQARPVVERLYTLAAVGNLAEASECLARLIKAEDGTIGRANAFVYSIRPKK